MKLDLLNVNCRGDGDFDSLSEVEKNLYVLLLFVSLHEMEGITHFFSHHLKHLPRLLDFLAVIEAPNSSAVADLAHFLKTKSGGSWDGAALENFFCNVKTKDVAKLDSWDRQYYSEVQEMWSRARKHVEQRYGVEFD